MKVGGGALETSGSGIIEGFAPMSNLFLIAHKVRGEPAFDVADQMTCPSCSEHNIEQNLWVNPKGCSTCEGKGYWWIIPTSGHRAYPYWDFPLKQIRLEDPLVPHVYMPLFYIIPCMTEGLRDHYEASVPRSISKPPRPQTPLEDLA